MKKITKFLIAIAFISLYSCSFNMTRVETDVYSVTELDTTFLYEQKNTPGNRDNGIIYPSSRTMKSERTLILRDSIVERRYPDFIRLGLFESVGMMFSGKDFSSGTGIFGIFPDFDSFQKRKKEKTYVFDGGLYRLGIAEYRLRWFQDAPNWTLGTSLVELIAPDTRLEKALISVLPIYIRKRFFIHENIPYIAFTPAVGIGYYPSQYINLSASFDIGSLSGLNLRTYLGYAYGYNSESSPQVRNSIYPSEAQTSSFPYIGVGISFLDFLNTVPETYNEWKEMEHSGWNIGFLQVGMLASGADISVFSSNDSSNSLGGFKGFMFKVANASVAIPVLNNQFYLGTSLASVLVFGKEEWGMGVLPVRFGYWQVILADELITEPFIEFSYYPSSIVNIANRVNLKLSEWLNINLVLGYAVGNTSNGFGNDIINELGKPKEFSRPYFGITLGITDRIFNPRDLRYNK